MNSDMEEATIVTTSNHDDDLDTNSSTKNSTRHIGTLNWSPSRSTTMAVDHHHHHHHPLSFFSNNPNTTIRQRLEWTGQTIASMCWIISVFLYGITSAGDWLQLCAASAWFLANMAASVAAWGS